jgi:hypothetical protein
MTALSTVRRPRSPHHLSSPNPKEKIQYPLCFSFLRKKHVLGSVGVKRKPLTLVDLFKKGKPHPLVVLWKYLICFPHARKTLEC